MAVQNRVKAMLAEAKVEIRDDLRKQFSTEDGNNPLAAFQAAIVRQMREQAEHLRVMNERIVELRAEKEKLEELDAEREKGTAKGRTYEEAVFDAIDAIARGRGDDCDAVGDTRGEGGKKGDVVVGVDAAGGPARGRIVFEAKDRQLSKNAALAELDGCLETRGAGYAVLVVPSEAELPARTFANHESTPTRSSACTTPRTARRCRWRSRTRWRGRACSWRATTPRASTRPRCARRSSAPSRRSKTSAASSRS